jgi:hypothetical protein
MKRPLVVAGAIVNLLLCAVCGAAAPNRSASVITIWRIPAPLAGDASVQAVEAGVIAVNFLAPQLAALSHHPGARVTLALDPIFVDALNNAALGKTALTAVAAGQVGAGDVKASDVLDVLSTDVAPASSIAVTPVGKRFISDASTARLALMGDPAARFSQSDDVDFAASAVLVTLTSSGYGRDQAALLKKDSLTGHDLQVLAAAFALACRDVLERMKKASASGAVELAALPAYEPIMPLIINAGGRRQHAPFTVSIGGIADVTYAVDRGMRAVRSLDPSHGDPGVLSPSGAYDDEAAVMLQEHRAAYGIFSERVVKANSGASAQSVSDVHAAAFRAYLLETSKTAKLPVFFCSDAMSASLDSQPPSAPSTAIADRLEDSAVAALAIAPQDSPTVVVLCLNGIGPVLRRPDRAQVLEDLTATLAGGRSIASATPKGYLRAHAPTAQTYGYEPGTDVGGFDLWMGSANQLSMWTALADARKAAGGDAAVTNAAARDSLLRAESGLWYLTLALPQPRYLTDQSLARFRALIADLYHAAGQRVPANIAPVKLDAPAPVGTSGS